MKLRTLILCSLMAALASLGGGVVVASARTRHKSVRYHRRHKRAVHRKLRHGAAHHTRAHHKIAHRTTAGAPVLSAIGGPAPGPTLFGINTLGYTGNWANFNQEMPKARSMGARWVHFTNDSVKFTGSGQPIWRTLDSEVTTARKLGLGVLVSLGGTPRACSASPRPSDFTGCPPTTRGDLYAYSLFLRAELVRYRNDVQYWESWLEPNNSAYWLPAVNARQYADLLRTQYAVFQSVNGEYHTDLKLLFGGPLSFSTAPPGQAVLPYVNRVLNDLHGARVFDAIGLHGYRFPASNSGPATEDWGPDAVNWDYVAGKSFPEGQGCTGGAQWCKMTWTDELNAYEQEFADHGYGQMPLWLTEFGWPGTATPSTALYPAEQTQATYLSQAYTDLLRLPFVQAAFVFNLEDYQPGIRTPDPAFFYNYGLLQYGFAAKPAASVYEQFVNANPGR